MYYKECPYCGAHLDPGERCDCQTTIEYYIKTPNKKRFAEATTPLKQSVIQEQEKHKTAFLV